MPGSPGLVVPTSVGTAIALVDANLGWRCCCPG